MDPIVPEILINGSVAGESTYTYKISGVPENQISSPGAYPITSRAEEGPRSRFAALGIRVAPQDMLELDMFLAPGSTLTVSDM